MQAYIKYKAYYDKKATASKPKEADYVLHLTAKSGSLRKLNSPYRFLVDWSLYYWKGVTEKQLFGTQNWHQ